jgi:hypothetical protein
LPVRQSYWTDLDLPAYDKNFWVNVIRKI